MTAKRKKKKKKSKRYCIYLVRSFPEDSTIITCYPDPVWSRGEYYTFNHNPTFLWVQRRLKRRALSCKITLEAISINRLQGVDKSLQQMKMGEKIPPEVWSYIRVHFYLCVDFPLKHIVSSKALSLQGERHQEMTTKVWAILFPVLFDWDDSCLFCVSQELLQVLKRKKRTATEEIKLRLNLQNSEESFYFHLHVSTFHAAWDNCLNKQREETYQW